MKTFQEACKAVFLTNKLEEKDQVAATQRLVDAQEKRLSLIDEITDSVEAHYLAASMLNIDEVDPMNCLLNIFAQGVLVGMEMEREEISNENSSSTRRETA